MAKTDVALAKDTSSLPAYLQDTSFRNEDNFDASDVVIPRIKLLQGTSPELETHDEAKKGLFWHSGMDVPLGTELKFIVADRRKKYLLSAPLNDGQGVLARADDAKTWNTLGKWQVSLKNIKEPVTWEIKDKDVIKSGLTQWGTMNPNDEDSPPAATLFYDYLVYLPDHPDLGMAVISLSRSQVKKAKKGLNDKIAAHASNGRPMQALIFMAKSVNEHNDEGDFKNWEFVSAGFNQDEALFGQLRDHRGALGRLRIQDENDTGQKDPDTDDGEGDF